MTPADPITDLVLQFLDANVDTIQQLEILRILGEDRERDWKASELASASQTKPAALPGQLAPLEQRGLIKTEQAGPELTCRFAPKTETLAKQLEDLLHAYQARPVSLIKRVYERTRQLSAFADSFRLRKES